MALTTGDIQQKSSDIFLEYLSKARGSNFAFLWSTFLFLSFFPPHLISITIKFRGEKRIGQNEVVDTVSCIILCFLFSLPSIWTQQKKMKSCGISAANKNGAGFHFPLFFCSYIFQKVWRSDANYLDSSQLCLSLTSHATGCDSSPGSLRHLRNSAVFSLCFRLKLNQTNQAGSNHAPLGGDASRTAPVRQHAWTTRWKRPVHRIMQLPVFF